MKSKAEERTALKRIKDIVSEMGTTSYIGIALEGCLEIAENNIDNDFACSMKQRADSAERTAQQKTKEAEAARAEVKSLEQINATLRGDIDRISKILADERKSHAEEVSSLNGSLAECRRDAEGMEHQIADLKAEIMRLKAQVYDLTFTK